jgi:threonine dehydratase
LLFRLSGSHSEKNAAMCAMGAEPIEHGDDFQEAHEYAGGISEAQGLHFVRSFDGEFLCGVAS